MGLVELGEPRKAALLLFGRGSSQFHVEIIGVGFIENNSVRILEVVDTSDWLLT